MSPSLFNFLATSSSVSSSTASSSNEPLTWERIVNAIDGFFAEYGLRIVVALLLLVVGIILVKLFNKLIKKLINKTRLAPITKSFLSSIVKGLLYFLLLLIVCQVAGIPVSGFVALLSVAGLAVSLALQDSLGNFFNGMILVSSKPFKIGEYVAIGSDEGTVMNISVMTTSLNTPDNKLVIIPNTTIIKSDIINYDRLGRRRVDCPYLLTYDTDLDLVEELIMKVIESNGCIYKDPKPVVTVGTPTVNGIQITSKCWVDSEDYWDVLYYLNKYTLNELRKNNIKFATNQMEVRVNETAEVKYPEITEELPERVEKVREVKKEENLTELINKVQTRKEKRLAKKKAKLEAKQKALEEKSKTIEIPLEEPKEENTENKEN